MILSTPEKAKTICQNLILKKLSSLSVWFDHS